MPCAGKKIIPALVICFVCSHIASLKWAFPEKKSITPVEDINKKFCGVRVKVLVEIPGGYVKI